MPTPVSSLLHAATMVCSGVYVLVRSWYILEYTPSVLIIILYLGGITTIVSGLIATVTNDIKRVIALSTMSLLAQDIWPPLLGGLYIRHQTICVEVYIYMLLSHILYYINSQITKARILYMKYFYNIYFNSFLLGKRIYKSFIWEYSFIRQYYIKYKSVKWIDIINRQLVGISEAIRLILIYLSFIYNKLYIQLIYPDYLMPYPISKEKYISYFIGKINKGDDTSLAKKSLKNNLNLEGDKLLKNVISNTSPINIKEGDNYDKGFAEWLAGLIDGDGYFNLSKQGSARFQITIDIRDERILKIIKNKYGGSIRKIANANALRYQLSHKKGLIKLINDINGNIRNPSRMLQMNKLCIKYGIELLYPKPLTFNNGWLSGIIDSDGSVYINIKSGQIFISITQKNKYILEPLIKIYSGRIDILSPKIEAFKYIVYRKSELFNLIDNYFNKYPLRSMKMNRINLIKQFYILYPYRNNHDINKFNNWIKYLDKWDKYN